MKQKMKNKRKSGTSDSGESALKTMEHRAANKRMAANCVERAMTWMLRWGASPSLSEAPSDWLFFPWRSFMA